MTSYRSQTGAPVPQYLIFSRPDIAYTVQHVCLHMHTPREPHLTALKRILRYLRGSLDYGLLRPSLMSELVVYTDADWAGCPDTRQSTSRFLGRQAVARRLPLQCRGRVPCRGQRRGRSLLAALAPPRAPQPPSARHPRLLRQRQRSTSPPILRRSTCTSSASVSPPVTFGFLAFPPRCNLLTFSPRDYLRVYF
jgi:hypothetical protein